MVTEREGSTVNIYVFVISKVCINVVHSSLHSFGPTIFAVHTQQFITCKSIT